MITRVAAWCVALAVLAGGWHLVRNWHNPFDYTAGSPVLSALPKASDGCGKDCK